MKNPVKMLSDLASRLAGARTALDDLHRLDRDLRDAHAAALAEHARLRGSLPPRADILEALNAEVDRLGGAWREQHAREVQAVVKPTAIQLAPGTKLLNAVGGGPVSFVTLCGLLPAAVKQALAETVDSKAMTTGPALAERPRLLEEIGARIVSLEKEHSELCDRAAELGIRLELLGDVRSRRMQAEQRRAHTVRTVDANRVAIARGRLGAGNLGLAQVDFDEAVRVLGITIVDDGDARDGAPLAAGGGA